MLEASTGSAPYHSIQQLLDKFTMEFLQFSNQMVNVSVMSSTSSIRKKRKPVSEDHHTETFATNKNPYLTHSLKSSDSSCYDSSITSNMNQASFSSNCYRLVDAQQRCMFWQDVITKKTFRIDQKTGNS